MPYDDEGRPLAGTLLEYLIPTISEIPEISFEETRTPDPNTPLGAKGAGESGCIGTPPAIANAVIDALEPADPSTLQMPLTPERCWEAMQGEHGSVKP
jgi:aerobic carbon-monoxide dehydrogenase large subunit